MKLKALKIGAMFTLMIMVVLSLASCGESTKSTSKTKDNSQPTLDAHSIPIKEEKKLLKDVKEDIKIVNRARDETSTLSKALTGTLLENTISQMATDTANNMIRVRKYDNAKFEIKNYTKGVAGVTMTFTDKGYFIDKKTKKRLTEPKDAETTLILALRKENGRWKIFELFSPGVKPEVKPK